MMNLGTELTSILVNEAQCPQVGGEEADEYAVTIGSNGQLKLVLCVRGTLLEVHLTEVSLRFYCTWKHIS